MKVLACDDDPRVGETLAAALRTAAAPRTDAFDLVFTTAGSECVELMGEVRPDVVVLDRVMPGIGGMEVARRLRSNGYRGPILLFSAFTGPDLDNDARALGVVPLPKDDFEGLLARLDAIRGETPAPTLGSTGGSRPG